MHSFEVFCALVSPHIFEHEKIKDECVRGYLSNPQFQIFDNDFQQRPSSTKYQTLSDVDIIKIERPSSLF